MRDALGAGGRAGRGAVRDDGEAKASPRSLNPSFHPRTHPSTPPTHPPTPPLAVLLDGTPLAQVDHAWLHRRVALVAQEPVLFADTIRANITYGCEGEVPQSEARKGGAWGEGHMHAAAARTPDRAPSARELS